MRSDDTCIVGVSIQLVSPASGEMKFDSHQEGYTVSIQLVSPASGESNIPSQQLGL